MTPVRLRGNIRVYCRKNKDKTLTYYLRWEEPKGSGKLTNRRLFRTEASPDRDSKKTWKRAARQAAFALDDELSGPRGRHLRFLTLNQARDWYLMWIRGDDERKPEYTPQVCRAADRLITSFIDYVQEMWPKTGPKGWKMNSLSCTHLSGSGQRKLDDGTVEVVPMGWWRWRMATQNLTVGTVRTECAVIRSWLIWCERHRYIDRTPMFVGPRAEPANRPLIIDDDDVRALLAAVRDKRGPLAHAAIYTLAVTGLRQGELRSLVVSDFLPDQQAISIRKFRRSRTKVHERMIPLGAHAVELVASSAAGKLPDNPLFATNGTPLTHEITKWTGRMCRPHDLRRWFCNHLIGWGCPQQWTDILLGHVNRSVDALYSNATLEELRAWTQQIDELLAQDGLEQNGEEPASISSRA